MNIKLFLSILVFSCFLRGISWAQPNPKALQNNTIDDHAQTTIKPINQMVSKSNDFQADSNWPMYLHDDCHTGHFTSLINKPILGKLFWSM